MDCRNIVFSPKQSQKRIDRALMVLPPKVFKRILLFALYLLGAKRKVIASFMKMPEESVKTTVNRILKDGLPALRDRRRSTKKCDFPLPESSQKPQVLLILEDDYCTIAFGNNGHKLRISRSHRVHLRTVLLSLLQSDLLTAHTVSSVLGITSSHCRELSAKLMSDGVTEVLVDKRKGQKQDFRFGLPVKAELIQHFAARAVTGYSISSKALAEIINKTQQTTISPRTVRWHMNKLGLMKIKKTLPELVNTLKKKLLSLFVGAGIHLSELQSNLSSMQTMLPGTVRRTAAVVLSGEEFTIRAAAAFAGCSISTVRRGLRRVTNTGDVCDLPRSGRPAIYSETFKLKLTGFYCQSQPFPNSGEMGTGK